MPLYLVERLPRLVSSVNPYHRRNPLERQVPRCRLELYKSSFFPSSTILWNCLADNIKESDSLGVIKRYLNSTDNKVPNYYYLQDRRLEILICKMRLEMSDLNDDLFKRHLSNSTSCNCGFPIENANHYLLHCPFYQQVRTQTITLLPNDVKSNVTTLLCGSENKTCSENSEILQTVAKYVLESNRFAHD